LARARDIARVLSLSALVFPAIAATGWILDIPILTKIFPQLSVTVPNSAAGLALAALTVVLLGQRSAPAWRKALGAFFAVILLLYGLLSLSEWIFGLDLGIDQILLPSREGRKTPFPGRTSPQSALMFILFGLALLATHLPPRLAYVSQFLAIGMTANAIIATTGMLFSTTEFYGLPMTTNVIGLSAHSSFSSILLAGALLISRPDEGVMAPIFSSTRSGHIARRIFLATLLAPPLAGLLTKLGAMAGWYGFVEQVSLFAIILIGVVLSTTWRAVKQAQVEELQADSAREALHRVAQERAIFAALVESSNDFIGVADANGKPTFLNKAGRRMIGIALDRPIDTVSILDCYSPAQRAFAGQVILKAMFEQGHWQGETEFINFQTGEPIPVWDEHFLINDPESGRILGHATITRDLTERKKTELALATTNLQYRALIEGAYDAIMISDANDRILMVNGQMAKWTGYTKDELIGQSGEILLPETYRGRYADFRRKRILDPRPGSVEGEPELYVKRKDGSIVPIEISLSPVNLPEGLRTIAIIRDLSEHRRHEGQQAFLSETARLLNETVDPQERIQRTVNAIVPKIADLCVIALLERDQLQFKAAAIRDESKLDLLKSLAPDSWVENGPWRSSAALTTRQPILVSDVWSRLRASEKIDPALIARIEEFNVTSFCNLPLIASGKVIGSLTLAMTGDSGREFSSADLDFVQIVAGRCATMIENARLYREAHFAQVVTDNLPALIAYGGADDRWQFANRAYFDWLGVPPAQLIGRTTRENLGEAYYERIAPYVKQALKGAPVTYEIDMLKRPTGEARQVKVTFIPDFVDGKVEGLFVMVTDVTELKHAQAEAVTAKGKAEAAVRIRDDVLAIVSHDLKNPLAAISLSTDILKTLRAQEIGKVHEYSGRIERSVAQMRTLIGDLLDFARFQGGGITIERFRERVEDVILPVADSIRTLAEAKRQYFEIDIAQGLPDVACDANRIGQVISNLLGNAVKFTPEGGTIRVMATPSANGVLVSVSDTGPGIAAEHLPKVFERYWQAKATQALGTGLGLSIAKGIVEAHGGRIWAESQVGRGSSFIFSLPLATAETRKRPPRQRPSPINISLKGQRILIVDDSHDLLALMKRILEMAGARVTTATSATEGLAKAAAEPPDVLITDIEMPGGNGYELLRSARNLMAIRQIRFPVIALTAHTDELELHKIYDAGFDASIGKPLDCERLIAALRRASGREAQL